MPIDPITHRRLFVVVRSSVPLFALLLLLLLIGHASHWDSFACSIPARLNAMIYALVPRIAIAIAIRHNALLRFSFRWRVISPRYSAPRRCSLRFASPRYRSGSRTQTHRLPNRQHDVPRDCQTQREQDEAFSKVSFFPVCRESAREPVPGGER